MTQVATANPTSNGKKLTGAALAAANRKAAKEAAAAAPASSDREARTRWQRIQEGLQRRTVSLVKKVEELNVLEKAIMDTEEGKLRMSEEQSLVIIESAGRFRDALRIATSAVDLVAPLPKDLPLPRIPKEKQTLKVGTRVEIKEKNLKAYGSDYLEDGEDFENLIVFKTCSDGASVICTFADHGKAPFKIRHLKIRAE